MRPSLLRSFGRPIIRHVEDIAGLMLTMYVAVRVTLQNNKLTSRTIFQVIAAQIYFTGFEALPLISLMGFGAGALANIQAVTQLNLLAGVEVTGQIFVITIVREVVPLLTALMVIARSGTAIASELGNMRTNREIETLEVLGINPLSYILFPRVVGGVISIVCLAIYFVMVAFVTGGLLLRIQTDLSFSYYTGLLLEALSGTDLFLFLVKNTVGGLLIFLVCCERGLAVQRSPTEVPQMTTHAVMRSLMYILSFNMTISLFFYLSQYLREGVRL